MPLPEVIIVSPYFPPSSLAGVHRARYLAKHLPSAGWKPIVVCVDEAYHEQRLDHALAHLVPADVEIIRVPAIPALITRCFGVGDLGLRAWFPLRSAVFRLLSTRNVKAVLITGSPFYPMMLAPLIKKRFGVPVVLDFQDPWASNWGAQQPLKSKAGLAYRVARFLEPRALRAAAHITSVSALQNNELAARYSWLEPSMLSEIPIGADPEDFIALRNTPDIASSVELKNKLTLAYVGTVWPPVLPTLKTFLRSLARVRESAPELFERLNILFVGTTGNPSSTGKHLVRPLAQEAGVDSVVQEIPQRLPFLEALAITARADANLIIGSNEPHYTASKVFGLLMSGRPYLTLLHQASSAHALAELAKGGIAVSFTSLEKLAQLEEALADAIIELATKPQVYATVDSSVYAHFEAKVIAARYGRIFSSLLQKA